MNNTFLIGHEIQHVDTGRKYKIIHTYINSSSNYEYMLLLDENNIIQETRTAEMYETWKLISINYKDI